MPRPLRLDFPGAVFHVTSHAVDGVHLFRDDADRHLYLGFCASALADHELTCLTYVLMTNHVHLIVLSRAGGLAAAMQWLNGRYAQRFNRRHRRRGALWASRYHAATILGDVHLREAIAYVADNPARAGMCDTPDAWPWSGHAELIGASPRRLVDVPSTLAYFAADGGDGETCYRDHLVSRSRRTG